ncbi:hypothetical protein H0E87_005917 [Populus deltoides]|uniref:S-locus glycoprotein domain-containing protein n=1 Tax=Populus deltoides TaxID=3696 RepID=A0A8T2Z4E9_POPDE|nr:hypothetical protein H0E87_005917 [Populus deltoides]
MEVGGVVSSRRTETNFSLGRFQLRLPDNGNLVLNYMNLPSKFVYDDYYSSEISDASNSSNSGYRLIFNESGYMYILRRNGLIEDLTKTALPTIDFYHRATLNFDGVFTQYFYPKASSGNRSWSSVWSKPDDICVNMGADLGSGACGYNSICNLKADKRPECKCPQGFSLLDQNDKYGSCIPDFELSCRDDGLNSTEDQPPPQLPGEKKKPDIKFITGSVVLGTSVFVNFVLVGAFCLTSSFIYRKKTEKVKEGGSVENPVLTDWAYDCYMDGSFDVLIGDDTEAKNDISTLERLLKVGIWCIQEDPSLRPTMRKVTQMLEGVVEVPAAPNPFPYSTISKYSQ